MDTVNIISTTDARGHASIYSQFVIKCLLINTFNQNLHLTSVITTYICIIRRMAIAELLETILSKKEYEVNSNLEILKKMDNSLSNDSYRRQQMM